MEIMIDAFGDIELTDPIDLDEEATAELMRGKKLLPEGLRILFAATQDPTLTPGQRILAVTTLVNIGYLISEALEVHQVHRKHRMEA